MTSREEPVNVAEAQLWAIENLASTEDADINFVLAQIGIMPNITADRNVIRSFRRQIIIAVASEMALRGHSQPPIIPIPDEAAEPTQYLVDQFREHGRHAQPAPMTSREELLATIQKAINKGFSDYGLTIDWRLRDFVAETIVAALPDHAQETGTPFEIIPRASWPASALTSPGAAAVQASWQPIETAPKDGTHILAVLSWLPYPKSLFWATYADEWRCPAVEDKNGPYLPTHWMPLPAHPSITSPSAAPAQMPERQTAMTAAGALEIAANIAESIDSGRGNEKQIARAIRDVAKRGYWFADKSTLASPSAAPAGTPARDVLDEIYDALAQAQDCIRGETPEDITDEAAREDTISKIRDAMRTVETALTSPNAAPAGTLPTPEQIEPILDDFLGVDSPHYEELRHRCAQRIFELCVVKSSLPIVPSDNKIASTVTSPSAAQCARCAKIDAALGPCTQAELDSMDSKAAQLLQMWCERAMKAEAALASLTHVGEVKL